MSTRLSFDLGDERLARLLRLVAAQENKSRKEIIKAALESYFADRQENRILAKAATEAFGEWDNPRDADYDKL